MIPEGAGGEQDKEEKSFGCWLVVTRRPSIISAELETWVRWHSGNGRGRNLCLVSSASEP